MAGIIHNDTFEWQIGEFCKFICTIEYYFDTGQNLYCNSIDYLFEGSGEMYNDFDGDKFINIYEGGLIAGYISCNYCLYFLYYKGGVFDFPCTTISNNFRQNSFKCYPNFEKSDLTFYGNNILEIKRGFSFLAENYVMVQCTKIFTDTSSRTSFFNQHRETIKSIVFGNYADVGDYAFYRIPYTEITCGPLNNVGESAFSNCNKLNDNIEILGTIGVYAFEYCYYLTDIKCSGESIGIYAFEHCDRLKTVDINTESIGYRAFNYCTGIKFLRCKANTIGDMAFLGCSGIESIELNAKSIGSESFGACSSLKSIDLKTVEKIGSTAFYNCTSLQYIYNFKYFVDSNDETVHRTSGIFRLTDSYYKSNPLQTYVSGDKEAILEYEWGTDYRILNIITGYTLNIENHNNEWITIPLASDSSGQLKFYCDDSIVTCNITDDLETKYSGVFIAVDKKWYQLK